jgi:hypothetical protein
MSRDLNDLIPEFRTKVKELLDLCDQSGYIMRPFFTLRTPYEQAKLWRQSRSFGEIQNKISDLEEAGANFLAHCIQDVGPQYGRKVTNAIPGFSWHQWGEAVDCFWLLDNKAEWSAEKKVNGKNGYNNYATAAKSLGLTAGGFWSSFQDWPHIQMQAASHPGKIYTLEEIDKTMKQRFGR